jgi:pimeloyl-ACP methyl ester carboxylesterase
MHGKGRRRRMTSAVSTSRVITSTPNGGRKRGTQQTKMATSAQGIVLGEAETVGYRYFAGVKGSCPPIRILYPASASASATPTTQRVGWFQEHGFGFFVNGYLHIVGIKHGTWLNRFLSPVFDTFASILSVASSYTLGWINVHTPLGLFAIDATPCPVKNDKKKLPLIVFSHGLTGTGQENLLLLSAWAKLGFVVASVHHTDGSSNRVRLETKQSREKEDLYYQHGPSFKNYDANFRPKQILHRSKEMKQAIDFVQNDPRLTDIVTNLNCDTDQVIVAGFSFGAATAVLTADMYPNSVKGLILLDGWFYIDVAESAGIEFEFPAQAFQPGKSFDIPNVIINSEQFAGVPKVYNATCRLAKILNSKSSDMHVLDGTMHNNFCDIVFWIPTFVLRKLSVIGSADPRTVYQDIIRISTDFLKNNY